MAKKIGLLGGSFNPIHMGHLVLAEAARERLGLERVLFVPNRQPPHKPMTGMASAEDRLRMVEAAIEGNPAFQACDIELRREGPSFSIDTVRELLERSAGTWDIHFLIGADSLAELPTWYDVAELARLCRFVVFRRPGDDLGDLGPLKGVLSDEQIEAIAQRRFDMPLIGVSATDVRRRVREGRSIRYLVPGAVRHIIEERRLYQ